jgi:uroporphyrinogen-III synthase
MGRPRILVTRSARQAPKLAEQLRSLGAEPILVPVIEQVAPSSYAPLDAAIARLTDFTEGQAAFHWLLFTSANAVQAFHERLQLSAATNPYPDLQVAAIGSATAQALEGIGLAPSLVPPQAVAESLAEALVPYARQPDGSPTRFLLVRAESGSTSTPREVLPETLRAAGAEVTVVPAYRTVVPEVSATALREIFSDAINYPDAITFTSSSSVRNLLGMLGEAGLTLPASIPRISIGPITSATLRELGLPPQVEATDASSEGLASALQVFHNLQVY